MSWVMTGKNRQAPAAGPGRKYASHNNWKSRPATLARRILTSMIGEFKVFHCPNRKGTSNFCTKPIYLALLLVLVPVPKFNFISSFNVSRFRLWKNFAGGQPLSTKVATNNAGSEPDTLIYPKRSGIALRTIYEQTPIYFYGDIMLSNTNIPITGFMLRTYHLIRRDDWAGPKKLGTGYEGRGRVTLSKINQSRAVLGACHRSAFHFSTRACLSACS